MQMIINLIVKEADEGVISESVKVNGVVGNEGETKVNNIRRVEQTKTHLESNSVATTET